MARMMAILKTSKPFTLCSLLKYYKFLPSFLNGLFRTGLKC